MLTNRQRRVIGNLGQPRNLAHLEHELRVDPGSPTFEKNDLVNFMDELEAEGLVVNLGEHDNMGKLAAAVQSNDRALPTWSDEQSKLWETRLSHPRFHWRAHGGDLWIISGDGVAALKEPGEDEPDPMTPSQVQTVLDAEWQRVVHDFVPGESSLAQGVLLDEFTAWAEAVADDCEARWNVRPRMPMAGGAGWTDAYESSLIDAENQKTGLGAVVDPWFMALTILAFSDTDTGTTADDGSHKPSYTGYARKSVAGTDMGAASAGSASNTSAITFAACTAGSSTIVGFGNCSASTLGTLRKYGTCSSTTVSTTQTPAQFAIGAYTTTAD